MISFRPEDVDYLMRWAEIGFGFIKIKVYETVWVVQDATYVWLVQCLG